MDLSYDVSFFCFNYAWTPNISPLPLHDALPISAFEPALGRLPNDAALRSQPTLSRLENLPGPRSLPRDRKSTRLNSSHANISYAVFCLKKTTHSPDARERGLADDQRKEHYRLIR